MLMLLDTYAPTYAVLVIALCECIAVAWVYGLSHLLIIYFHVGPFMYWFASAQL